jgi:pyruvate,orthophosphate dikinase
VQGLAKKTDNERFAWDSYRRFVQMFGNVVRGIEGKQFEDEIKRVKADRGVKDDTELDVEALQELTGSFKELYEFPTTRASSSSRRSGPSLIPGTASARSPTGASTASPTTGARRQRAADGVRQQGRQQRSGVAFSRDEVTGAPQPSGDFLINAQGEDVVSGVRNTLDIADLEKELPDVNAQLMEILRELERHYGDMQDTEFTVEEGQLYMLQTRNAKRPAQAAVRFAVDAVEEGLLDKGQALSTIDPETLDALLHPTFDPQAQYDGARLGRGCLAGCGDRRDRVHRRRRGGGRGRRARRDPRAPFTEADDVAGFHAAKGIVTSEGGKASHAALVARGMGVPAVTGASDLEIDPAAGEVRVDGTTLHAGDRLAIDGTTGSITTDDVPLDRARGRGGLRHRPAAGPTSCGRWRCAPTPTRPRTRARRASSAPRASGCAAPSTCSSARTATRRWSGSSSPPRSTSAASASTSSRRCSRATSRALRGDGGPAGHHPPARPAAARVPPRSRRPPEGPQRDRARSLQEVNPMLGTRGVRLGLLYPEIYEMQVRAMTRAPRPCASAPGEMPHLEVMIPLIDYERELELMRDQIERIAHEEGMEHPADYTIGTMIELPRACFLADHIAEHADFFSFGTNDLTQTRLGFSRDDIEGKILARYIDLKVFDRSPFETIDAPASGRCCAWAPGWAARPSPTSSSASAASTGETPTRSTSSTTRASTTCPAARTACPSRASPPRRPRSAPPPASRPRRPPPRPRAAPREEEPATCTSELVGGRCTSTNSSRTLRIVGRPAMSTTKIVSLTTSAHVASPAASACRRSGSQAACASQSPAGATVPSAATGTWPAGPHEPAGRGEAHDVAVAAGSPEAVGRSELDRGHGFDTIEPPRPSSLHHKEMPVPDLQFLEPASFGPSSMPFSQGVRPATCSSSPGRAPSTTTATSSARTTSASRPA